LHLGVTEAGEAEDGRIKSAVGIGTLLEDGLGDTVRVSLTEEPEFEAPVAQMLVDKVTERKASNPIRSTDFTLYQPFEYQKRQTSEVVNIGGENVPRIIADLSSIPDIQVKDLKAVGHFYLPELDKWAMNDTGVDYIYSGSNPISFMLPNGLREIVDYENWMSHQEKLNKYPLISKDLLQGAELHPQLNFLKISLDDLDDGVISQLKETDNLVIVGWTDHPGAYADFRSRMLELMRSKNRIPFIIHSQNK
ncbi:unnamed protein product, partial [Chrysoparadoxa australica]